MSHYKKPSLSDFEKVAHATGGNKSDMAKRLKCDRKSVQRWVAEDAEFAAALEDANESLIDLAESQNRRLITGVPITEGDKLIGWKTEPNITAIIFTLKTKGKERGWTEHGPAGTGKGRRRVTIDEHGGISIEYDSDEP